MINMDHESLNKLYESYVKMLNIVNVLVYEIKYFIVISVKCSYNFIYSTQNIAPHSLPIIIIKILFCNIYQLTKYCVLLIVNKNICIKIIKNIKS